jgi:hypothetical protein
MPSVSNHEAKERGYDLDDVLPLHSFATGPEARLQDLLVDLADAGHRQFLDELSARAKTGPNAGATSGARGTRPRASAISPPWKTSSPAHAMSIAQPIRNLPRSARCSEVPGSGFSGTSDRRRHS